MIRNSYTKAFCLMRILFYQTTLRYDCELTYQNYFHSAPIGFISQMGNPLIKASFRFPMRMKVKNVHVYIYIHLYIYIYIYHTPCILNILISLQVREYTKTNEGYYKLCDEKQTGKEPVECIGDCFPILQQSLFLFFRFHFIAKHLNVI